eukprot:6176867-Pleurochrysis_carterae.AAC.1
MEPSPARVRRQPDRSVGGRMKAATERASERTQLGSDASSVSASSTHRLPSALARAPLPAPLIE